MNLNDFDDILKQKLKDISVHHAAPDWDRMSKELDEDSVKDQIFDEQINRKLQQLKVHQFAKPNWTGLYTLIERRIQNKRRVIINKTFEVSLVLLLFFTAFNIGFQSQQNIPSSDDHLNQSSPSFYAQSETLKNDKSNIALVTNPSEDQQSLSESLVNDQKSSKANTRLTYQSTPLATLNLSMVDDASISAVQGTALNTQEWNQQLHQDHTVKENLLVNHIDDIPDEIMAKAFAKDFPTLQLDHLELHALESDVAINHSAVLGLQKVSSPNWFIAASTGINLNHIESALYKWIDQNDDSFHRNSDGHQSPYRSSYNSQVALRFGYALGKIEISSGINYQQVDYDVDLTTTDFNLSSKTETHFSNIKYDFLSIPLELSVPIYSQNAWKARIHAGAFVNLLLNTQNSVEQRIKRGSQLYEAYQEDVDLSYLDYDFPTGYFSDEDRHGKSHMFSEYARYKALFGLSLSKRIRANTEIFGRTDFLYQLPSTSLLNKNIDLINAVSFNIGIKKYIS